MKWRMGVLEKGNKAKQGFTLVELLIVVIIVGILAAAAIPLYFGFVKRAYITEAKATVAGIRTGEQVWYAEHLDWLVPATGTDYTTTEAVLGALGVDIDGNRWFYVDDISWPTTGSGDALEQWVKVLKNDDTSAVDDLGAQICLDTGVLQYTTDGGTTAWKE